MSASTISSPEFEDKLSLYTVSRDDILVWYARGSYYQNTLFHTLFNTAFLSRTHTELQRN